MTFENVQKIKGELETYPKVKFYSLVDEKRLLIQNEETQAVYEIGYTDTEGSLAFDTSEAKQIAEKVEVPTIIDEVRENLGRLQDGIHNVFAGEVFEESVTNLKEVIKTLPSVDKQALNEALDIEGELKSDPEQEPISEFGSKYVKQVEMYNEERKEFEKTINLFNEDNELNPGQFFERSEVNKSLEQMSNLHEQFKSDAIKYNDVRQQVTELLENDQSLSDKFFSRMDLTKNLKVSVTKNLVELKQMKDSLNIKDLAPKISGIFENVMMNVEGQPSPVVYNMATDNKYRPKFFRFKMGIFTAEDVKVMIGELNDALSRLGSYNDEEMMFIAGSKMQLEYMYNAQQINDHLIIEMVQEFNKRFAMDQSKDYEDTSKQLMWKDREQQKQGNAQGMAQ